MADAIVNQLIAAFSNAWSELSQSMLGCESDASLLDTREIAESEINKALEATQEYASAFVAQSSGKLVGTMLILFKAMDRIEIEQLVKTTDISNQEGCISLINTVLSSVADNLGADAGGAIAFSSVRFVDLYGADNPELMRLAASIAGPLQTSTFALTVGDSLQSQMKLFFAPSATGASEQFFSAATEQAAAAGATTGNATFVTSAGRTPGASDDPSRNIERLLEVELEVVVRFGKTQMALRDLVRVGVGSMIELNRQVDDPVELLVNNHSLARGTVVVVDGYYGVRITEIGKPEERRLSLTKA